LAGVLARDSRWDDAFARLQKLDAVLAGAFQDVSVPAGLAARILDRVSPADQQCEASPPVRRRKRYVRYSLGALTAAAATLLVAAWLFGNRPGDYTASAVLENAVALFNSQPQEEGQLIAQRSPPWSYPFSSAIRALPRARWREISGFLGTSGVAYDLTDASGTRATLYVVKRSVPALSGAPPMRPAYSTANCSAAAWKEGSLLYVLVVQGGAGSYQNFFDAPRWPLT
jgi:hypothetical protein